MKFPWQMKHNIFGLKRPHFNIGVKIYIALTLFAIMTISASLFGIKRVELIAGILENVSNDGLNSLKESLSLAAKSRDLGETGALATKGVISLEKAHLQQKLQELTASAQNISKRIQNQDLARNLTQPLRVMDELLPKLVNSIALREQLSVKRNQALTQAKLDHHRLHQALMSVIEEMRQEPTTSSATPADVTIENNESDKQPPTPEPLSATDQSSKDTTSYQATNNILPSLLKLDALINLLMLTLTDAATGADSKAIDQAVQTIPTQIEAIQKELMLLPDNDDFRRVRFMILQFIKNGEGDQIVGQLRKKAIAAEAASEKLLGQLQKMTSDLAHHGVIGIAETQSRGAIDGTANEISLSKTLLYSFAMISVVFALLVGYFLIQRLILRRLKILRTSMNNLASGDMNAEIPTGDKDEIGEMAATLLIFRDNIKEIEQAKIRETANREEATRERENAMMLMTQEFDKSVRGTANQMSLVITDLNKAALTMQKSVHYTSEQNNHAAKAAEETQLNMKNCASIIEELKSAITEIAKQVSQSASISRDSVQKASKALSMADELKSTSEKISSIVELINVIAHKTNLLALNATIEAARAGEAGRGFSVVANEVKVLASQTGKATEDIGGLIANIRHISDEVVRAITDIDTTVRTVDDVSSMIAIAIEKQDRATENISATIHNAVTGAEEASAYIAKANEAASQSEAASATVQNASQTSNVQTRDLQSAIDNFVNAIKVKKTG